MLNAVASRVVGALDTAHRTQVMSPLKSRGYQESTTRGIVSDSPDNGFRRHVLLIDDDPAPIRDQLRVAFPAPTTWVHVVGGGKAGLEYVRTASPDVIVLTLGICDRSGLEFYQQIRSLHAGTPVIVVVRPEKADSAIEAMKYGAYDCLFKPVDLRLLRCAVGDALTLAKCMRQLAVPDEAVPDAEGAILGSCPAMCEVYKAIGRVAMQDVPVLITGESGTGKDLVARAVYQHGPRAKAPFLALNCAAIPENLLESELFGHEKGAFTGADRRRIGKFEQCHGGTLFLDEIGDMPVALQAKILRLMQDQSFERVGGNETIRTDVRLIAATHRDLKAWAEAGKFRHDLYYRLGVFSIHLPALHERGDDLPILARHYVRRFSHELARDVRQIAPEALERLRAYGWPGNVRELQSVLKQALLRASGRVLLPAFLPDLLDQPNQPAVAPGSSLHDRDLNTFIQERLGSDGPELYTETHAYVDRLLLKRVLEHTGGSQHKAARLLGIARQTLRGKLRELGLTVMQSIHDDE